MHIACVSLLGSFAWNPDEELSSGGEMAVETQLYGAFPCWYGDSSEGSRLRTVSKWSDGRSHFSRPGCRTRKAESRGSQMTMLRGNQKTQNQLLSAPGNVTVRAGQLR